MATTLQILTEDGVQLSATYYTANDSTAVILLNPGTATKTAFYLPFCQFLQSHSYDVVLWNYRGFDASKTAPLSTCDYRYSDIGHYDIPAVIDAVAKLRPDLPLYCIGHSAGGQQMGLAPNYHKLDALIAVAVSAGYFAHMPLGYRIKANFFFRVFAPVTGVLFNYVPAKRFNFMEDLPLELSREWAAWCKEKQLFFSAKYFGKSVPDTTFKNFDIPTFVLTADDDEICTERNVSNFWQHVTSKHPITFKRYKSSELPGKTIGHFGYFRKQNLPIWQDILNIINELQHEKSKSI